jgi:hypothetical protein
MKKKSPLISLIPFAVNTVISIVKDKRKAKESATEFVHEDFEKGVQISSKRLLNVIGTTTIIGLSISHIESEGLSELNLIMLIVGVCYAGIMSYISAKSETI